MLQLILNKSDRFSIEEVAQMAIEGGCGWIEMSPKTVGRQSVRETALAIRELCEEAGTIFVIQHDVDLVDELKVSGVHLSSGDMKPSEAREKLGPHAIIGVDVETPEEVILLQPADIDYVVVGPYRNRFTIDDYAGFVDRLREKGCNTAVVASGDINLGDVGLLLGAGVSGIAVSEAISSSPDPVKETAMFLSKANQD